MWEVSRLKFHKKVAHSLVAFVLFSLFAIPAWSAVTSVTCTKTAVQLGGKDYIKCSGSMNGTVPSNGNTYKAPVTMLYSKKASQFNGTAIISAKCYTMQETSYMDFDGHDMATVSCGAQIFPEKFIGGKGYTFVELDWNKYVLDAAADMGRPIAGYHKNDIQDPMDVHQILRDIKGLVTNPPSGLSDMTHANIVIATGFSGGNSIWNEYFLNQNPTAYDGFLQVASQPICTDMHFNTINDPLSSYPSCTQPITAAAAAGKVISIASETDLQIFNGGFLRLEGPDFSNYRYYEVPGSHVPKGLINLDDIFPDIQPNFRQNVANSFKPVGAMCENLRLWIKNGTLPPPSIGLKGAPAVLANTGIPCASFLANFGIVGDFCDHFGNSPDFPIMGGFDGGLDPVSELVELDMNGNPLVDAEGNFVEARDDNGNALGGIRLPYVEVPLGEYNGLELGPNNQLPPELRPEWERILGWQAGGFYNRFADGFDVGSINNHYPTNKIYVNKVVAAAQALLNNRLITADDYVDYVVTAKNSAIGKQSTYTDAELEAAHGVFF